MRWVRQGHSLLFATCFMWRSREGQRILGSKLANNITHSSCNKPNSEIKCPDWRRPLHFCAWIFICIFKTTIFQCQKGKELHYFLLSEYEHMKISCMHLDFFLTFCHSVILKTCLYNSLSPTAIKIRRIRKAAAQEQKWVPVSFSWKSANTSLLWNKRIVV